MIFGSKQTKNDSDDSMTYKEMVILERLSDWVDGAFFRSRYTFTDMTMIQIIDSREFSSAATESMSNDIGWLGETLNIISIQSLDSGSIRGSNTNPNTMYALINVIKIVTLVCLTRNEV